MRSLQLHTEMPRPRQPQMQTDAEDDSASTRPLPQNSMIFQNGEEPLEKVSSKTLCNLPLISMAVTFLGKSEHNQKHAKRYLEFNVKCNEVLGLEMVFVFLVFVFFFLPVWLSHGTSKRSHGTWDNFLKKDHPTHGRIFSIPRPFSFSACSSVTRKTSTFPEHT